jgi:DNA-binding CsgD family transcriptional regulator
VLQISVQPLQGLRGRAFRLGPLLQLALLGAVVGVLTVAAVATWVESRVDDLMLHLIRERAMDQVHLGIMTAVRNNDFEVPYSADKRADLAARLDPLLGRIRDSDPGIIRLNLFARDGTILYSDNPGLRGQTVSPLRDQLLGHALAGQPAIQFSTLEDSEDADLRLTYGRALEAYIPVILNERVVGAYECDADLASIEPIRPLVWGGVAAAALVVVSSLLAVLVKTSDVSPGPLALSRASGPGRSQLGRRELDVLRLMADGLTYGQIAEALVVDEETVRSHAKSVLRKLGQPNRAAAVAAATRAGLLDRVPAAKAQPAPPPTPASPNYPRDRLDRCVQDLR